MSISSEYLNVQSFRSRHNNGKVYHYHRPTKTRLSGEPGTTEFDESYRAACAKWDVTKPLRPVGRFVYFVQGEETARIKVGMSRNPANRLAKITTDCSEPVKLLRAVWRLDASVVEASFRREFADVHSHGEWFHFSPRILDYIQNVDDQPLDQTTSQPLVK